MEQNGNAFQFNNLQQQQQQQFAQFMVNLRSFNFPLIFNSNIAFVAESEWPRPDAAEPDDWWFHFSF
jgi:hypothetical protein